MPIPSWPHPCQGSPPFLGALDGGLEQAHWPAVAHTCGQEQDVSPGGGPTARSSEAPGTHDSFELSLARPARSGSPQWLSLHPFLDTASVCPLTVDEYQEGPGHKERWAGITTQCRYYPPASHHRVPSAA